MNWSSRVPFGVQKREMSLRQPGLMRKQQPLVNRWGRKNEELRTSNSRVWVKKTASTRGAELARNHKSMWTVEECCLLVVRGLERPSNFVGLSRGICGISLICKVCSRPFMSCKWVNKEDIGAKTVKRIQRETFISLYQRLKMNNNHGWSEPEVTLVWVLFRPKTNIWNSLHQNIELDNVLPVSDLKPLSESVPGFAGEGGQ